MMNYFPAIKNEWAIGMFRHLDSFEQTEQEARSICIKHWKILLIQRFRRENLSCGDKSRSLVPTVGEKGTLKGHRARDDNAYL